MGPGGRRAAHSCSPPSAPPAGLCQRDRNWKQSPCVTHRKRRLPPPRRLCSRGFTSCEPLAQTGDMCGPRRRSHPAGHSRRLRSQARPPRLRKSGRHNFSSPPGTPGYTHAHPHTHNAQRGMQMHTHMRLHACTNIHVHEYTYTPTHAL